MKTIQSTLFLILITLASYSQTNKPVTTNNVKKTELSYKKTKKPATFQGGDINKFNEWVILNLIYPPEALELHSQGLVILQFCVDTTGYICDIKIVKKSGFTYLDTEATRVILSSPKWNPAILKGSAIKQQFTLPINFKLIEP